MSRFKFNRGNIVYFAEPILEDGDCWGYTCIEAEVRRVDCREINYPYTISYINSGGYQYRQVDDYRLFSTLAAAEAFIMADLIPDDEEN